MRFFRLGGEREMAISCINRQYLWVHSLSLLPQCCSTAAQNVKIGKAFSHVHATYLSPYFMPHIGLLTEEGERAKVRDFNNL
jgi:hypothetical protein